MFHFAQGQGLHFRLQLYDMNLLVARLSGVITIKLEANPKICADPPKTWELSPPYSMDVKILNHRFQLKSFPQREFKADYLYKVSIKDQTGAIDVRSQGDPAKILEKPRYVEQRVADQLHKLSFKCTPIGGSGRPDIIATHPNTPRANFDVEVNYSLDKYTLNKFATDLEKFERFSAKEPDLERLLIVHCGAYVESGVLKHPKLKQSNITIISLRSLADLVHAVTQRQLTQSDALVYLLRSGEVTYRCAGAPPFDPVPDPYPVTLQHWFMKKRFDYKDTQRGRPPTSEVLPLRDIEVADILPTLEYASKNHESYRTKGRFSASLMEHMRADNGRRVPAASWARTLQGLGLFSSRCRLTTDGEQLLKLWQTKARRAAEERLAFHFLSGTHIMDVLALVEATARSKTRYQTKAQFLGGVGKLLEDKHIAPSAIAGARIASEVLKWVEQLHLGPGWDSKVKTYRLDSKRIERIMKNSGHA